MSSAFTTWKVPDAGFFVLLVSCVRSSEGLYEFSLVSKFYEKRIHSGPNILASVGQQSYSVWTFVGQLVPVLIMTFVFSFVFVCKTNILPLLMLNP